jgi:hypothetical protein
VFIDKRVEKSRVVFRCYLEETQQWSALEIPEWMFDSACSTMRLVEVPVVGCEGLRSLKALLAGASNHDLTVKEAQRFEGGVDATDTESKTTAIGVVPSDNSDSSMGSSPIGGEAQDHPVTITTVAPAFGEPTRPREQGGRS